MATIRTLVLATVVAVGLPAQARTGTESALEEPESPATVLAQPTPNGEGSLETSVGTEASRTGAGTGLLRGVGFVLTAWVYACIIGGPLTLFICVVGFPEYWPYLVAAVVVGGGIGAVIGAASGSSSSGRRRRQRLRHAPGQPARAGATVRGKLRPAPGGPTESVASGPAGYMEVGCHTDSPPPPA